MPSLEAKYVENNMRHILLGLIVVAAAATQAKAARIELTVGDPAAPLGAPFALQPDTPNQEVPIYIRTIDDGGLTLRQAEVGAFDFYVAIANGGTDFEDAFNSQPGVPPLQIADGPKITAWNLNGGIFDGLPGLSLDARTFFPAEQGGDPNRTNYPIQLMLIQATLLGAADAFIPANGKFINLIVDTTGFDDDGSGQTWMLEMDDIFADDGLPGAFVTKFGIRGASGLGESLAVTTGSESLLVVPEPSSWILATLGIALAGFVGWRRRRRTV